MKLVIVLVCLLSLTNAAITDPVAAAKAMANQMFDNHNQFFLWEYGSAIINDALWESIDVVPGVNYISNLNTVLNNFENNNGQTGFNILHNVKMPFGGAVGDTIGLFPIAYLARVNHYAKHPDSSYDPKNDLAIVQGVLDNYILPWPYQLKDGTFCRAGDQVWCDDQFMGTALGARYTIYVNKTTPYLAKLAPMQQTFWERLNDPKTNVTWHGYYEDTKTATCCKWSRANGWGMMSHVEVLKALKAVDPKNSNYPTVLRIFQSHAKAAQLLQDKTGLWHQVLDVPSTFLETSTTAMFLLSFIEGVENGWLSNSEFSNTIKQAWSGLATTINADGTVNGICEGTGIGSNVAFYEARTTNYSNSSPGLGSVLKAALAMIRYNSMKFD